MNNSEQIFTIALGLEDPWSIKEIIFDRDNSQLDIYLKLVTIQYANSWQVGTTSPKGLSLV